MTGRRQLTITPTTQPADGGVLGHRCTCGHPDLWHRETYDASGDPMRPCGDANCRCRAVTIAHPPGQPSLVHPAWDSTTGERIAHVIPPGQTEHGLRSCACDSCRALHDQHTTSTGATA